MSTLLFSFIEIDFYADIISTNADKKIRKKVFIDE